MCDIIYIFKFKIPSTVIVIMEKIKFVKKKINLKFMPCFTGLRKTLVIIPFSISEFVTPEVTYNNISEGRRSSERTEMEIIWKFPLLMK